MSMHPDTARGLDVIQQVGLVAGMARNIDLDTVKEILEQEHRMHSVGAILDPTRYRDHLYNPNVERNLKLLQAFVAWRKAADEVAADYGVPA